ncbi:MAG: FAD-binding oxidoreductase, partial [Microcystaceae cyanobacterium]
LKGDQLNQQDLALLQPYQPNIAVTWLFQKTMSVGLIQNPNPNQINELMSAVFAVMDNLGEDVLRPFLQDVIQFSGLSKTLPLVNPTKVLPILTQVGIEPLANWLKDYFNLGLYTGFSSLATIFSPLTKKLTAEQKYRFHRWLEAWQYGSGKDIN